jgi:Asp-tRNA(Asn)/Glu-tRNA(Gln) amidotransferase A subunit family amidase
MKQALHEWSIAQAARAMETGELSARNLTQACLERIEARNAEVQAFVACDPALALREAARVDAGPRGGKLRGIPFAVKDVIHTADYPTTFGSPIYENYRSGRDAACVATAREQGAVLLGKVATSEFATQTPGPTRNPLRLAHTPGGSSSGSAAAVADGMAFAAWGTQTTGSITRPAAYCGVVGYKPTFGLVSSVGMGGLSPLQDTVGVLARTVADAGTFVFGAQGAQALQREAAPRGLRIGLCFSSQWEFASDATVAAIERFVARVGAAVRRVSLPLEFEALIGDQGRMVAYDARQALAHERLSCPERLSERLLRRMQGGEDIDLQEYLAMGRRAALGRLQADVLFSDVDVLIYPAADGEAEWGLEASGSPRFGALWTLLHMPTVAFPFDRGASGLPLGLQVIGRAGGDMCLLQAAMRLEEMAGFSR